MRLAAARARLGLVIDSAFMAESCRAGASSSRPTSRATREQIFSPRVGSCSVAHEFSPGELCGATSVVRPPVPIGCSSGSASSTAWCNFGGAICSAAQPERARQDDERASPVSEAESNQNALAASPDDSPPDSCAGDRNARAHDRWLRSWPSRSRVQRSIENGCLVPNASETCRRNGPNSTISSLPDTQDLGCIE